MPAFELHSAIARPEKKAKPSDPAGFEAMRLTCSPMMSSAPLGRMPESFARWSLTVPASANSP